MQKEILQLLDRVDAQRIANLTLGLVRIPSPSGQEAEATEFFARHLCEMGLEVEIDQTYPESPSIIAYVRGDEDGPTLQLDGHIDTISAGHPPGEIRDDRVYGRGSADMKGNLAAMAEAARILCQSGLKFKGNLMLTVHGQHEDAVGDNPMHAPLLALFDQKIYGDAAIICEGPHDGVVIAAKGLTFWEIDIYREGDEMHEVTSGGTTNPLWVAYKILRALEEEAARWAKQPDPDVGPQTFFVGQITGGDYYNRVPTHVHMKGTRRTIPRVTFEAVQEGFQALVGRIAREMEVRVDLKLLQSGQSYRLSPDEPVVCALRKAYAFIKGVPMTYIGLRYTGNASQFNNIAGVPAVYFGSGSTRAHATPEWVEIPSLARAAKIYLLTALYYLGNVVGEE